jgi:hypothetical protein
MKIIKSWKKFNESYNRYGDELSYNNGLYALNLNFNLRQLGAKIETPHIESLSHFPYVLVSEDKILLDQLREYLKGLSKEDLEGIRFYNGKVDPFGEGGYVPFSNFGMCEITKEELNKCSHHNNVLTNDELYDRCKENRGDTPEGKVYSYFLLKRRDIYSEKDYIEVGVDVTEGVKKFLEMKKM